MTTTQQATIRKTGSADHGYHVVECHHPDCKDVNGRPWSVMHSRRTAEGARLAERDASEHNTARHAESQITYDAATNSWVMTGQPKPEAPPLTACPRCGAITVKYSQKSYGDQWDCTDPSCGYSHYFSIGD